jgi:hypothetical protein
MIRPLVLVAAIACAGCPRLPPPPARPQARLLAVERGAPGPDIRALKVRLGIEPHGARMSAVAVDWELSTAGGPLVRGRSTALAFRIELPPDADLRPAAPLRLRGAVHLEGPDGRMMASFDEQARAP